MGKLVPTRVIDCARHLLAQRYPGAAFAYAAGSLVRDHGADATATSDLDLVVIYEQLPHARRESYEFEDLPVEAFIHDPQTLHHFMAEVDGRSGFPLMPHMVLTGIEVPGPTPLSAALKRLAKDVLDQGPPPLSEAEVKWRRYLISDALDDLRDARNRQEAIATASALYGMLADAYLRLRGRWSGKGKWIPRLLHQADPAYATQFTTAFAHLYAHGEIAGVEAVARATVAPFGGLFEFAEGHQQDAPVECRKALPLAGAAGAASRRAQAKCRAEER